MVSIAESPAPNLDLKIHFTKNQIVSNDSF